MIIVNDKKERIIDYYYAGKGWNRLKIFFRDSRKKVGLVNVKKGMECKGNSAGISRNLLNRSECYGISRVNKENTVVFFFLFFKRKRINFKIFIAGIFI